MAAPRVSRLSCLRASARDRPLEDHRDVVRRTRLEVDGGDGNELPPLIPKLVQLGRRIRVEAVVLAADVDDLVLPLAHSTRSFPGLGAQGNSLYLGRTKFRHRIVTGTTSPDLRPSRSVPALEIVPANDDGGPAGDPPRAGEIVAVERPP